MNEWRNRALEGTVVSGTIFGCPVGEHPGWGQCGENHIVGPCDTVRRQKRVVRDVNRATRSGEALLGILNKLENWGEKDILLAAIDRMTEFPGAIAVYTTNAIESINYTIQKIIKHRYSFSNDEAVMKFKNICNRLTIPIRD